jgi:hypothetical protein
MDIDLTRLPCSILSLDVQDVMGIHVLNIGGNLKKYKLDKDGKVLGEEPAKETKPAPSGHSHDDDDDDNLPDYEMVKQQLANQEGCKVKGSVVVNKVC